MADQLIEELPGFFVLQHRQIEGSDIGVVVVFTRAEILFEEFIWITINGFHYGNKRDAVEVGHDWEAVWIDLLSVPH